MWQIVYAKSYFFIEKDHIRNEFVVSSFATSKNYTKLIWVTIFLWFSFLFFFILLRRDTTDFEWKHEKIKLGRMCGNMLCVCNSHSIRNHSRGIKSYSSRIHVHISEMSIVPFWEDVKRKKMIHFDSILNTRPLITKSYE